MDVLEYGYYAMCLLVTKEKLGVNCLSHSEEETEVLNGKVTQWQYKKAPKSSEQWILSTDHKQWILSTDHKLIIGMP